MDNIILIGAGGHARACIDVIESTGIYKIAGLVEKLDFQAIDNLGYSLIGTDNDLPELRKIYKKALITVGQIDSAATRVKLFELISDLKFQIPVVVSPRAHVSKHSNIGDGTIIMHDVLVNANAKIGQNCIINTKALIEHDTVVNDHCHISTGAIVNGKVTIGRESFIGSGAVTKQSISIGDKCFINAGCTIKTNIESHKVIKNG